MRMLRPAAAAAVVITSIALATAPHGGAAAAGLAGTAADGAYVVSEQQVDSRTLDVTIYSPAVAADTTVRLLLPPGWSPMAARTWPVL